MKTHEILYQTLAQAQDYVNGEQLAQEMGLSRTSIWKAIQRLEKEGIEIESVKNRGYKILSGDLLIPQVIEDLCPLTVSYNPQCQSTQLDAKNAMEAGGQSATLYLAPFQTAGKGRFGRDYFCPSQGGIYMSLHLKPNLSYLDLPAYTLLTAAAIYKAVKNLCLIDLDIKWVNDIYFKNKKIAGILTEAMTSVETGLVTDVIIGLGINFSIADFPEDLKEKAGSLFMPPAPISRNELISEIWNCFYNTDSDELLYIYKERSIVLGKEVTFQLDGKFEKGLAKEISESGQLQVEFEDKHTIWLNSGEISLTGW